MQFGVQTACALVIAGLALGNFAPAHADSLKVKTAQGKVHGKLINDGKVRAFLGLPYAAPPVGDLRWRAPQPPARWKGVRDATHYIAHCFQGVIYKDTTFQDGSESEDCLYLNVYVPADSSPKGELPVMFWIHGGGYRGGAGTERRHNGDFLAAKGVVLVTINYRLSAFGFLATTELAGEGGGTTGNYGLLDMVAALQWVKANIRRFGGNPENVTIFGESAGSFAVSTLMVSPLAQGLFQKAIGESGAAFGNVLATETLKVREQKDDMWVATLGVNSLEELRALPAEKIISAALDRKYGFTPVIDGKLLTEPVADTFAAGKQAHIPLLAGWNRDEGESDGMTAEKWKVFAAEHLKDRAEEFLKLYPGNTDGQAARSAADYNGDMFIAFGTWKWLEAQTKTGDSPVYRYHFELAALPSTYHSALAFHSDDIEYVFGTLDTRPGGTTRPEDRKLSGQMMDYWTNFAKTGDPNGPGLPQWPRYDKTGELIHLDATITSGPDTVRPRYKFLLKGMPGETPR